MKVVGITQTSLRWNHNVMWDITNLHFATDVWATEWRKKSSNQSSGKEPKFYGFLKSCWRWVPKISPPLLLVCSTFCVTDREKWRVKIRLPSKRISKTVKNSSNPKTDKNKLTKPHLVSTKCIPFLKSQTNWSNMFS